MKTFILFGGASGIGLETAKILSTENQRVIVTSRNQEKLNLVRLENTDTRLCDLSEDSVESIFSYATETFGEIEGVANLCGSVLLKPAHLTSLSEFNSVLEANLRTSFLILKHATKHMINHGGGSIVFIASAASQIGLANHEAIAAAKGAVMSMAKSAAASYASKNIRVNCVAPGLTKTGLTARITNNEAGLKASLAKHPLGRIGEPAEVANAVRFLLDPKNSWITGQVLGVDGGLGALK